MTSSLISLNAFPGGLATAPSISVLGAFFPDWLFCIVGALILTVLTHHALLAIGLVRRAGRMAWLVVYPALGVIFALCGWLAFFQK